MLILQSVLAVVVVLVTGVTIGFLISRTPRVTGAPEVRELREPEFEIYKDKARKFRFRLKAPNREIIAVGEAYESKAGCRKGIESIKRNAPIATVVDLTSVTEVSESEARGMEPLFEVYRDAAGMFRFRLKAVNREIIAVGEGYKSKAGCRKGIESIKRNAPIATVIDLTE